MASIAKRPNGQWRARYRDDSGKEHSRHFARKADGTDWLAQQVTAVATGTHVLPRAGKITVQSFYDDWSRRQVWTAGTTKAMDLALKSSQLGELQLGKVRASHLEAWVKRMTDQPLAPGTIKTRFNNVRSVFRSAIRDKLIRDDPTGAIRLPRLRRAEVAMTIPDVVTVGKLLVGGADDFKCFIALCAFAGLRLGEAAAVQVGDIDFLRRTLNVTRQVQRAGKHQVEIRGPKYGSERTVYIPEALVTMLSQHVQAFTFGNQPDRWLFQGEPGDPPHQNTVGYWWRKAKVAAGVDSVRLHDLRHFYASGLIASGCDVVAVQRSLGHSTATTTLNTYAHLWPSAEDRTRKAAADLMRSATSSADLLRTEKT